MEMWFVERAGESECKALSSNSSITKKKKERKKASSCGCSLVGESLPSIRKTLGVIPAQQKRPRCGSIHKSLQRKMFLKLNSKR
jgi:hypothetical protein